MSIIVLFREETHKMTEHTCDVPCPPVESGQNLSSNGNRSWERHSLCDDMASMLVS